MTERAKTTLPVIALRHDDKEELLVDPTKFAEEQHAWAKKQAEVLDWDDSNAVMMFASAPQKKMSEFLDTLLDGVNAMEAGPAGDIVIALSEGIEKTKLGDFQKMAQKAMQGGMVGKFLRKLWKMAKIFIKKYCDLDKLLVEIEKRILKRRDNLIEQNVKMDGLYLENSNYQDEMALWVIAGEYASQIGKEKLAEFKKIASGSRDPKDGEIARNFGEQVTSFEVRLVDMKTAYFRAIVNGPQIRTAQQATKIELQNIQRTILTHITNLKSAIVNAVSVYQIVLAQGDRQAREEAIRRIELANAEGLKQAFISAKKSQGQDLLEEVVHVAGLAQKLLETLEEGRRLDEENKQKRTEAVKTLVEAKKQLRAGLNKLESVQE